ncbi:phosphatase PAP2 family protein [Poriferisphaera sp. WC338]|uniref:phosphatase PAP2 family protein n=1 Tax=Poriferisphaera sp. WC338 TaxID=3425129 RepID=UPI003D81712E
MSVNDEQYESQSPDEQAVVNHADDHVSSLGERARQNGLWLSGVRRDMKILAILGGIVVLICYLFFDWRVSWFVLDLPDTIRTWTDHLTQFGDSLYYFIAIILGLVLNWVWQKQVWKQDWYWWVGYVVLVWLVFWVAKLWEGYGWVTLLGIGLTLWLVRQKKDYASWMFFMIGALAWTGIGVNLIKVLFGRFRPTMLLETGEFGFSWFSVVYNQLSFPSGHAATTGTIACVLWLMKPRLWFVWFALGVIIAFTRIFTHSHFISDVLAGSYVGVILTLWLHYLVTKPGKIGEKLVPLSASTVT